jgi:hypothetical protein
VTREGRRDTGALAVGALAITLVSLITGFLLQDIPFSLELGSIGYSDVMNVGACCALMILVIVAIYFSFAAFLLLRNRE